MPEVACGDHHDAPSQGFQPFAAQNIALPLATVALVVPAVVLDHNEPPSQHQVAPGDEVALRVDDVDVALGFG